MAKNSHRARQLPRKMREKLAATGRESRIRRRKWTSRNNNTETDVAEKDIKKWGGDDTKEKAETTWRIENTEMSTKAYLLQLQKAEIFRFGCRFRAATGRKRVTSSTGAALTHTVTKQYLL